MSLASSKTVPTRALKDISARQVSSHFDKLGVNKQPATLELTLELIQELRFAILISPESKSCVRYENNPGGCANNPQDCLRGIVQW